MLSPGIIFLHEAGDTFFLYLEEAAAALRGEYGLDILGMVH